MQYEGSEEFTTVKHIKNNILTWRQHVNQTEHRKASKDWRLISQGCCNRNSHRLNTNLEYHTLKTLGNIKGSNLPASSEPKWSKWRFKSLRRMYKSSSTTPSLCTLEVEVGPRRSDVPASSEHALGMWVSLWNSKKRIHSGKATKQKLHGKV